MCLLPLPFVYFSFAYKDYFYLVPAAVALVLALVFNKGGILSKKEISLPDIKLSKPKRFWIKLLKVQAVKKLKKKSFYKRLTKYSFSGQIILLLAFTAIFIFITVYKLPNEPKLTNILLAYLQAHLNFAKENSFPASVFILFSMLFVGIRLRQKTKRKKLYLVFLSIFTTIIITFLSLSLAYLGAFFYGVSEAGILSYKTKVNPASAGMLWGKDKIVEEIRNRREAPKLVGVDTPVDKVILELTLEEDKRKSDFYKKRITKNIPDALLPSLGIPKESLVLYKNYLLITELIKEDIEAVSPIIGKLYLKRQLAPRYIKDEPRVQVMGKQEYLKYRDEQIDKKIAEVDKIIAWAQSSINILYGNIRTDKQQIEANKAGLENAIVERESQDNYCRTATSCYYFYYFKQCYRHFTDAQCDDYRRQWDDYIAKLQKDISYWESALTQDQRQLSEFLEYKEYFEDIMALVETQKDIVPYELGVFEPEKSIKVALESTSNEAIAAYFSTLVHEYLHYTSYVSEKRIIPTFFEEGLTEYFTRKVIGKELKAATNSGYSHIVKVIQEMTKKIPEEEFRQVYFTKDERALIALLNKAYGSKFYQDTENYFWAMTLISSEEALKFANNIMFRIGGTELKKEDLFYTASD